MPLFSPECCETMPSNPHSVVLSLPTLSDVICYEEKTLAIPVQAGYPRFVEGTLLGSVQHELSRLIASRPCTSRLPPPLVILVTCASFGESMLAWVRGSLLEGRGGEDTLLEDTCVVPGAPLMDYCLGGSTSSTPVTWKEGVVAGGSPAKGGAGWAALVIWTPTALHHPSISAAARVFQQHTGCRLNTRCAEVVGTALGVVNRPAAAAGCEEGEEGVSSDDTGRATIQALLQRIFFTPLAAGAAAAAGGGGAAVLLNPPTAKLPFLAPNGMAAFTAVYTAVQVASAMTSVHGKGTAAVPAAAAAGSGKWGCPSHPHGRHCDMWLQVGCLYLDTAEVLKKFPAPPCPTCDALDSGVVVVGVGKEGEAAQSSGSSSPSHPHLLVCDPLDTPALAATLSKWGGRLAGVVTEVPSNPLLLTTHLPTLASLIATHAPNACLVVDPTMAGLGNVNPAPHADAVVCSLTKFLGCSGDVMGGGVMVGGGGVCGGPNAHRLALALDVCNGVGSSGGGGGNGDGDGGGEATLKPLRQWCSPYLPWAWGTSSSSDGLQPHHHHHHQCCPPPMPSGSVRKLAMAAPTLPTTLARMNASTVQVARWLEARLSADRAAAAAAAAAATATATNPPQGGDNIPALRLRAVHWVLGEGCPRSRENYLCVATRRSGGGFGSGAAPAAGGEDCEEEAGPGCMITFELEGTWPLEPGFTHENAGEVLSRFYGGLHCVKGPSFGTLFTLASPFIYLAHYDQVVCEQGRVDLCRAGINPYLVRLSVGVEPVGEIIAALEAAFAC